MRENKQIYADLEKLSLEYERTKLAALSPAEKEQLSRYELYDIADVGLRMGLLNNGCLERLQGTCCRA